jgi:RNA polymerase sigma factor (sigma-70 family)
MTLESSARFSELYEANYADVLRFVRRRAHPVNVDDIVGETFLAAWRRRDELPSDPRPWLFGTARRAMLNASRGVQRQLTLAARMGSEPMNTPDEFADVEQLIDLTAAWRALPAADQEVLALHVWEDLSAQDAAAVLGITRAGYSMRLSRAKRRLAELVGRPSAPRSLATSH